MPADFQAVLAGISAGVTVQDDRGRLVYVNADAARMAGFASPGDMLAAAPVLFERFEMIDEEGQPLDLDRLPGRRLLEGQAVDPLVVGFRLLGDGTEHWSMLLARATTLADGRRVVINTFHDVTSRIEAERRIIASERRSREIAEQRRRAEEIARMLADATLRLDEAHDVQSVADAAAVGTIPVLADWVMVDLLGLPGQPHRRALAACDQHVTAALQPLRDRSPIAPPKPGPRTRPPSARGGPDPIAVDPDLRRDLEAVGVRATIIRPLIARGEALGAILFGTIGDRGFDAAADAATIEMAGRVAIALANTRSRELEQHARRAAEELAARMERLQAVTRALADATSIDHVAALIADEVRDALGAQEVVVGLLDDAATRLDVAGWSAGGRRKGPLPGPVALDADVPIATAVREVRTVRSARPTAEEPGSAGSAVPLVADQAPVGGLWVRFDHAQELAGEDERLMRAYADLAAGAIARLRLGEVRQLLLAANEAERARLDSVLRQMPIGVILAAVPDGRFLYANEAARRISPIPPDLGATPKYDLARGYRRDGRELGPDDWPIRRAMAGETVENDLIDVVYGDGSRRTWSYSAAPIPGPTGRIETAVVTFTDATERILEQDRVAFLARATEVLGSSLDYERTVQTVAELAVPDFADWCVVELTSDEGMPRRIAVAHRDPELVALAARLQEEYPPDPDATSGSAQVMRTGRSEFVEEIPPGMLDAAARDDRHRELIRTLALRSYLSVPLLASGRILGALTLVGTETGRRLASGDIKFAEALAARAAAAIENARLFREGVRFKRLLDATGDAILMVDPEAGRIVYANRGAAEQLERPVGELVGSLIDEHVEPSGSSALDGAISAIAGGHVETRTVTVRLRSRRGAIRPVEVRLEYVAPDGTPARILAIARDIGDRLQAQDRLRRLAASEHARAAELNAVIRAMGDGVVVCDPDGRIILANPAAEQVFPEVDETTYAEILGELDDPGGLAPTLGVRGGPVALRVRGPEERWIEVSTWPVAAGRVGNEGHDDETIVLLRDVTEQRKQQVVRDTFIGVLSHELRTPVTTIYAGAKVLARPAELAGDTREEIFNDIVIEAERLHRLVEDVVAMTRFGEEGGDVGTEPVLLQRLLPAVVASEDRRWPGVEFEIELAPGLPTVVADPTYVEQVVRNLLSNAAKYGGPGARVAATAEAGDDEVIVRITDDGPGFPPDEQDRLFELFFRSAGTARAAAGAGIGLFVCARLIRAMGGRIWAVNRPMGGAEFGFALRVMSDEL